MGRTSFNRFPKRIFIQTNPILSFKSYFCFWIIKIMLKILSVFLCLKST